MSADGCYCGDEGGFCASEVSSACRSSWWMTRNSSSFLCCNLSKTHKLHSWRMREAHTHITTHTSSLSSVALWQVGPIYLRTPTTLVISANDELSLPDLSREAVIDLCEGFWVFAGCLSLLKLCCLLGWAGELKWRLFWMVTGSEVIRDHRCGGGKWWLIVRELMCEL